ncbi:MAG: glutamine synthetase type III [Bacteroidetes bacterium]|jgi:glutamine synthetase|nr:glutamine synthetase type III [Bacteroidota bacterium]MBT3423348.1 glutamine synthetase type III [Bacteroidota bacterium]MBT4339770.1 glutamine synthetase type III [Bacteroidota bacterium]MBT4730059.1 glutamine synthetase type III [Bacteroidota bacterium]MBT4969763.1 glutamine synthetase type III [Bacteroidota bacterium]
MSYLRFSALEDIRKRKAIDVKLPSVKTSEYFAVNVFDLKKMQEYLSEEAYESVKNAVESGSKIDRKVAEQIASGMKSWALDRGASHYTHWFQPLHGTTAEKHDAFFQPTKDGGVIESFGGDKLVQQEPDASSFPSGGIRNTFEARGYTAWDPSSPAFVIGTTLCIPTIFVAYTGEALDYKTPLLRSLTALDSAAVKVCQLFDRNVTKVIGTLGWEQEYFLVDEALYHARPDLMLTKRTLMGHASAKDQQLADNYFGSIPERVMSFMKELEIEAYKLGIPIKTRHNEVAPNQFECAPVFEEVNLAVDHNQLLMDIMEKIAKHHYFRVLFHEKPYKGVNGSGKHCNWSLATNTGINLLSPGKTPKLNLQFLTFLVNTMKAVHDWQDLIRASIMSSGNSHRLGGHEAPPAIISVFIGQQLTKMLDEIVNRVSNKKMSPDEKTGLKLDVGKIPEILLDNTDRNRTSPFAFTGNRFEFRAVGGSANTANPMITLNTVMANQLNEFMTDVNKAREKGVKKDEAIFQVLRNYIIKSKRIRFEGDGYSDNWVKEAEKRGLSNITDVPDSFSAIITKEAKALFTKTNVLSEVEINARFDIRLERFTKKIQIESRVLGDLAINHIIPTCINYQTKLIENVKGIKQVCTVDEFNSVSALQMETIKEISHRISQAKMLVDQMKEERKKANNMEKILDKANYYSKVVIPYLGKIRSHIDRLELIVDDRMWPMPKYRELLFNR